MKYIRHKHDGFVIFDINVTDHEGMMKKMGWTPDEVVSAGKVRFDDCVVGDSPLAGLYCFGSSMILRKHVIEDDDQQMHLSFTTAQ